MSDTPPTVSVLLPVYNGRRYLREAVASVLAQTFGNWELVAVDDGSTDGSADVLRSFADPRIRILTRPNGGIAAALNDGIAAARGELLARLDADDVARPDRLAKQVAFLHAHPDVVLLGSRVCLTEPFGSPVYESDHAADHDAIERDLLRGIGWAVVHPAAMMRAAAVRAAGGYRPDRVPIEDLDLFLRLTEHGRAANLPDVLTDYRQHLGSANHTRFAEQERLKRSCVAEAYARRGLPLPDGWQPAPRRPMPVRRELTQWAWTALKHNRPAAARRHALGVLRRAPFSVQTWRLLFCAARGH